MLAIAGQTAGPAELAEISFFSKIYFFLNRTFYIRFFKHKQQIKKTSKFVIWTGYLSEITNSDKFKKIMYN